MTVVVDKEPTICENEAKMEISFLSELGEQTNLEPKAMILPLIQVTYDSGFIVAKSDMKLQL